MARVIVEGQIVKSELRSIYRDERGRFVRQPMPAEAVTDVPLDAGELMASVAKQAWRRRVATSLRWCAVGMAYASVGFLIGYLAAMCFDKGITQ